MNGVDGLEPMTERGTNKYLTEACQQRREAYRYLNHATVWGIEMGSNLDKMNLNLGGNGEDIAKYAKEFDKARIKAKHYIKKGGKALLKCHDFWDKGERELEFREENREEMFVKSRAIERRNSI